MSSKEKLLASAQKNLQKGQIAKAIKDYQQVVELDPKDIRNRQKLAELCCRARMNAEALGEFGAVARYYADNGFYLKAIAVYKQMQKLDPEQVNVYHRLAELNVKQGLVGNALAEYRNLAAYFEKKKLLPDAIGVLQKMAELEPENLNIHVKIAESYALAGLRDKAREEFAQVLGLLREAREFSRMAKLYEMFLHLFPNDPEMKAGLAEALICKGEVEKGLQLLKALLRDNAENSQILTALAFGYRENGDFENERLTYLHLLKQAPGDLELREGYIRACLDAGEHRRVLGELDEWKEAFFDAGRASVLKAFYEDLLEVLPGNEQVQRALSLFYEQVGDEGKLLDTAAVRESLAEPPPEAELEAAEAAAEELEEAVAAKTSAAVPLEPAPAPGQFKPDESAGGAEEMPLDFLEAAVELGEPFSETHFAGVVEPPLQDEIEQETAAGEMELELELELDEPLVAVDVHPGEETAGEWREEEREGPVVSGAEALPAPAFLPDEGALLSASLFEETPADEETGEVLLATTGEAAEPFELMPHELAAETDVAGQTEEVLEELEPDEVLEELEELEEFEPEDALEELGPEELLDELELFPCPEAPDTLAAGAAAREEAGGRSLGLELRELLAEVEAVPGGAKNGRVRAELEEAEFYLQQGLLDDAERVCRQLLESDPACSEARVKLEELAGLRRQVVTAPAEYELFGLPVAMRNDEAQRAPEEMPGLDVADRFSLDGVFDEFRKGVETQVDVEDTETHYNLGIAYKEMGLLDDAIAEFDKAMKNPVRLVDSLTLKGTCLFAKGALDQAEAVFKSGLVYPGLNSAERISLHYEMGLLYEAWGRPLEALDSFQSAADADLFFRNVGEKIEALRKTLGLDASNGKEDPRAKGDKSRVSYV